MGLLLSKISTVYQFCLILLKYEMDIDKILFK